MPTRHDAPSPRQTSPAPERAASRFPFSDYPVGWFAVAFSEDVKPGEIKQMRYFGRELVLYRGESGEAFVTDAYCPHMGAHFAHGGKVEGDCVRCPFHGWKFSNDGRCVEVPYSDRIPPKAKLKAWPVCEQNGVIHVFYRRDETQEVWKLPVLDDSELVLGRSCGRGSRPTRRRSSRTPSTARTSARSTAAARPRSTAPSARVTTSRSTSSSTPPAMSSICRAR